MNDYEKQAVVFLEETSTTFKAEFVENGKHFSDDTEERDIYKITLTRGELTYEFRFGQSIAESGMRLFLDKKMTKRTKHIGFIVPQDVRDSIKANNNKDFGKGMTWGHPLKRWFEKEHFSLSGLSFDLGKIPTAYDVLTCLTKNDPDTFEEFCDNFGYDKDSRKAEKTYFAVRDEFKEVRLLWTDEQIEKLQEIQ